jgi:hypothetical protein
MREELKLEIKQSCFAFANVLLADRKPAHSCDKCGRPMNPAPSKLRADGEQTYCGYLPCPCDKRIMTDFGVVYPNTEEHSMILEIGKWNYNDLM